MDYTYTYGVLPPQEIFDKQFDKYVEDNDRLYVIKNSGLIGSYTFTKEHLWNFIKSWTENKVPIWADDTIDKDAALNFVSDILYTLKIEWI